MCTRLSWKVLNGFLTHHRRLRIVIDLCYYVRVVIRRRRRRSAVHRDYNIIMLSPRILFAYFRQRKRDIPTARRRYYVHDVAYEKCRFKIFSLRRRNETPYTPFALKRGSLVGFRDVQDRKYILIYYSFFFFFLIGLRSYLQRVYCIRSPGSMSPQWIKSQEFRGKNVKHDCRQPRIISYCALF